jgi:hypothetical protein
MVIGRTLVRLAPIGVGLVAAGLGAWRAMPGVGFWDTAEFQTIPPILGTAHPTGYPTYVILGWLASMALSPLGEAAFRMNLLSAILVGIAAAIMVDLVRMLTGSTILGVVAGLGLAMTPIVWSIGTHADPHALHLVFLAGLLWLLLRWETDRLENPSRADRWLIGAAIMTGLSAGNHSLTFLLAVPIGLYVLAVEPGILSRTRLVGLCIVAFAVPTILVYLELPIRGGAIPSLEASLVYGRPDTLGGFVYVVTGEQFRGGLYDPFGELPRKLADVADLGIRELGPLAAFVVAGFVVMAVRFPAFALLTGTTMFITCFFNAAYINADIERYYLGPVLIAWTWLAVLAAAIVDGITGTQTRAARFQGPQDDDTEPQEPPDAVPRPRRAGSWPDPFRTAATVLASLLLLGPTIAAFPARAGIVDRTADQGARPWLDAVLAELPPDSVVVSWWSYSTPLWYAQQIEGRRTDVFVADDRTRLDLNLGEVADVIDANLGTRPVFVIRFDRQELDMLGARYSLTPLASPLASNILRVTARTTAGVRP